jgi:hypothetical protein
MNELLARLKKVALSDTQLMGLINNKANIILYPDLWQVDSIDDILNPYGACIIFFESDIKDNARFGHWCLLFKLDDHHLEFFNPYGGYPDDSLKYIPDDLKHSTHQDKPYLSLLLLRSPYDLSYNEYKFQHEAKNIMTCGRHVACRLNNRDLSLEEYHKMLITCLDQLNKKLNKKLNFDDLVSILTS